MIALPARNNSPSANEADRSALVVALRSAFHESSLLSGARFSKAVIPRFAVNDPFVLVLLQKRRRDDSDFILPFRPTEAGWKHDDVMFDRFGDLSDLIGRINARAWQTLDVPAEK